MKFSLVGPGIMPIPPNGWGAVEIIIWDYKINLEKYKKILQEQQEKRLQEPQKG